MNNHNFESAYVDESGDSGKKGSKYLVLTLLCTSKRKQINEIIRGTKQQLLRKNKTAKWFNRLGEVKYSSFPDKTLLAHTLDKLAKVDSRVYYLAIEKDNRDIDRAFKNMILRELIKDILSIGSLPNKIIADKQYFKDSKIAYFTAKEIKPVEDNMEIKDKKFIMETLTKDEFIRQDREKCEIEISVEHHNSKLNEELQALDLISGAIFASFEHQNESYLEILKNKKIKIKGQKVKV